MILTQREIRQITRLLWRNTKYDCPACKVQSITKKKDGTILVTSGNNPPPTYTLKFELRYSDGEYRWHQINADRVNVELVIESESK
jgi:hypothetical protein